MIDDIYVSSDSNEILTIAQQNGANGLIRDKSLCANNIRNYDVLCHHFKELRHSNKEPEIIALIQPTTPFRLSNDLTFMIKKLEADIEADSLITVKKSKRARGIIKGKYWVNNIASSNDKSQNLQSKDEYEATGHLVLLRPKNTLGKGSLLGKNIIAENLPFNWPDIDIDTRKDWERAESYIKKEK